jgi:GMP synthase (glutamine-hydrolysing)
MKNHGILIFDYGSQYTLLIARRLRELGIFCEISSDLSQTQFDFDIDAMILSGGPDSVQDKNARGLPTLFGDFAKPVMGICYGMQLLIANNGGKIQSAKGREYGRSEIITQPSSNHLAQLLEDTPETQSVWMSHGDDVTDLGRDFELLAKSETNIIAAVAHKTKPWLGIQFHPEVAHSEFGQQILKNFVTKIAAAKTDWQSSNIISQLSAELRQQVGQGKVLMAVSGGVDSTVAAALLTHALGKKQVVPVMIDNGLLRLNEADLVKESMKQLNMDHLIVLDCRERFISELQNVSDPETKRKIIGKLFIEEFESFAKSVPNLTHLGQGTLYPDVIESAGHGAGAKVIKTHHNVGGLPEKLSLKLVEPFKWLFKDEVRALGLELNLPRELIERHPFPGPGLAVRLPGAIDIERINILQQVDEIFISELRSANLYHKTWQAFAVLLPVKSVGVMGDNRSYEYVCSLRAVNSVDAMTAEPANLPFEFLTRVAATIVGKVQGVNRVLYDISSKPPATIEWE